MSYMRKQKRREARKHASRRIERDFIRHLCSYHPYTIYDVDKFYKHLKKKETQS